MLASITKALSGNLHTEQSMDAIAALVAGADAIPEVFNASESCGLPNAALLRLPAASPTFANPWPVARSGVVIASITAAVNALKIVRVKSVVGILFIVPFTPLLIYGRRDERHRAKVTLALLAVQRQLFIASLYHCKDTPLPSTLKGALL